jgi:hypothetical protein
MFWEWRFEIERGWIEVRGGRQGRGVWEESVRVGEGVERGMWREGV